MSTESASHNRQRWIAQSATALHRWVTQAMRPALRRDGTRVSRLRVPAHYACRTRNHRPGARISEHGKGRAIDISAIELANGDTVTVRDDWAGSRYSRALRRMHQNACGIFGTTLGGGGGGQGRTECTRIIFIMTPPNIVAVPTAGSANLKISNLISRA